jgi:hypothetical protein
LHFKASVSQKELTAALWGTDAICGCSQHTE